MTSITTASSNTTVVDRKFYGYPNQTSFEEGNPSLFSSPVEILIKCLYTLVIASALALNGVVCYLYAKKRVRRSPSNFTLLLLSVTDMTSAFFMTPYVFVDMYNIRGISKRGLSYLCGITTGISLYWISTFVSACILSMISVTHYFAINHATRMTWFQKSRSIAKMYPAIWIIGVVVTGPNALTFSFEDIRRICLRDWPSWLSPIGYSVGTSVLGMIPVTIMLYTLFMSVRSLWFRPVTQGADLAATLYRKRVVSLLAILMLAFFSCFLPAAIYWVISWGTKYFPKGPKGHYKRVKALKIVVLLALMNTVLDPIIYAIRAKEFRLGFIKLFSFQQSNFGGKDRNIRKSSSTQKLENKVAGSQSGSNSSGFERKSCP